MKSINAVSKGYLSPTALIFMFAGGSVWTVIENSPFHRQTCCSLENLGCKQPKHNKTVNSQIT
jgi:hypothetical protein